MLTNRTDLVGGITLPPDQPPDIYCPLANRKPVLLLLLLTESRDLALSGDDIPHDTFIQRLAADARDANLLEMFHSSKQMVCAASSPNSRHSTLAHHQFASHSSDGVS